MKKVVIMGASSGIGLKVAEAFASRGVKVGVAARKTEALKELKSKYPGMVEYEAIDVNTPQAPERLGNLIEALGGMDIYFHVAGIGYENLSLDPQREVDIIQTNAGGLARMCSTAYRYFRDNNVKGARIAAVTSVAGTKGVGRLSAYSASKKCAQTYLVALEQLAHIEKADISFIDIRPGWVRTPLLYNGVKYPLEMNLDDVVPQIIRAIVKRDRVRVIDARWNALVGLWRTIPNALWVKMDMKISTPDAAVPAPGADPFPDMLTEIRHEQTPEH